ncbi:hypothetical protein ASPACDRAFT_121261 [Aspergillus aculeatus ATCC 16872]|uniref:Zn(2)-C6 fungal-type domain-containing protein n=1 Tax=Aspergillus aculeatus (strain ATCC 16872 / CBS 172.66 / WB 5094) TaxID=690307 RepID=A0A1L9WRI4_ASPA1|nr:uncharacterized protein ASPACDRAFT_121261 [Aspergillus aculeatus ATCC 16872]OJJ98698.1 hypothetical protein ASPACDRAFT_121261 [Aspergillus aculeatus ATCC 16872]
MASTVDDHVLPTLDLDIVLDLTDPGAVADIPDLELDDQSPFLAAEVTTQGTTPTPSDEGGVSTPNSAPVNTPRTSASRGRRKGKVATKPRRVRTGCLTCRERHLKCDEALHQCQNCRKSGRICRRGIRLNFIDTQTATPPHCVVRLQGKGITFRDESRIIASEYVGGFERYPPLVAEEAEPHGMAGSLNSNAPATVKDSYMQGFGNAQSDNIGASLSSLPHSASLFPDPSTSYAPFRSTRHGHINSTNHTCLNNPEEVFLLQVFVEEVGLWMDAMDAVKHFTQVLPFHALEEPMLFKAILACGARHLYHVNPSYGEQKAALFHDEASQYLLRSLQDPDRDSALCATTAILLNIYELMSGRPIQGMSHIAGARALIKECNWDAKTPGLGGACFWLNVSMELISCLHFNWALSWNPDSWGVDLEFDQAQPSVAGNEEAWTHKMVFICAKVANFRSSMGQDQGVDDPISDARVSQRYQEWCTYNEWCDQWVRAVPRSMMPVGYLHSWQTNSKSVFPEIWLIKRSTIVAQLLYHTTRILLTKTNPVESEFSAEMQTIQQGHARDICGIVAHSKDRGVASLSIRFLAIAAGCLVTREAQHEVFEILDHIIKETGWRTESVKNELQAAWGWSSHHGPPMATSEEIVAMFGSGDGHDHPDAPLRPCHISPESKIVGVVNPLMASADFSMENHPYQDHYVAPHRALGGFSFGL